MFEALFYVLELWVNIKYKIIFLQRAYILMGKMYYY